MPLFSTAQSFDGEPDTSRNMTVKVNGGSILVEVLHDASTGAWVTSDTITLDGVYSVDFDVLKLRLTPEGGATFSLAIRQ